MLNLVLLLRIGNTFVVIWHGGNLWWQLMKRLAATQPAELQCRRSNTNRWAKVMAEMLQINELTNRIAYSLVRWFRINLKASFVLAGGGHWWWLQSVSESGGKWGSFQVVVSI
jgi:hypothetical protein